MWQCFSDIVHPVAAAVQIVAGIFGVWFAWKTYMKMEVQETIDMDAVPRAQGDVPRLKLFETSMQTTWLKETAKGLECHLDERRNGKMGGHKWTLSRQAVKTILETSDIYVHPGYKIRTGRISIGRHVNWFYSKKLFPEPADLHHRVIALLKSVARESGEAG